MEKTQVNLAVIGLGNMGKPHTGWIDELDNARLVAVCDIVSEKADALAEKYGAAAYYDYRELLKHPDLDGILIATPHYYHTIIAIEAFKKGIHVLTEKPVAVHAKDAQKMIDAYEKAKKTYPKLVFAAMFQQRTHGYWKKIKELIDSGELGKLVRTTWLITEWFRTQTYYDNGGWRATWKGEGGGVLLNQCPHNLDLYQWFVGVPDRITGFASIGKYHNIEVEDEVTGYFEYDNGMVGHFITTTGEAPGSNRLEIVGENGKLIFENEKLTFFRNRKSMLDDIQTSTSGFARVENWEINIPYPETKGTPHQMVTENFANAILHGDDLIAPAPEGIKSVSIGNAILLSSMTHKTVPMPIDQDEYAALLDDLIKNSKFEKTVREIEVTDMEKSFH